MDNYAYKAWQFKKCKWITVFLTNTKVTNIYVLSSQNGKIFSLTKGLKFPI